MNNLMAGMMAVLMAGAVHAQSDKVTVCVGVGIDRQPVLLAQVQDIATKIFSSAGVGIDWRHTVRHCPSDAIRISRRYSTAADFHSRALVYAQAFEGSTIEIFMDRIQANYTLQRGWNTDLGFFETI